MTATTKPFRRASMVRSTVAYVTIGAATLAIGVAVFFLQHHFREVTPTTPSAMTTTESECLSPSNVTSASTNSPAPSPPFSHRFTNCGTSRTTALAQDCTFDPVSFVWVPTRCSDPELTTQFLSLANWTWYTDKFGILPVPIDEVLGGYHEQLYVTAKYHILHCTYMWRKMHRAMLNGWPLDNYISNYHHTGHCEMMIEEMSKMMDQEVVDTTIVMKWPDCPGV